MGGNSLISEKLCGGAPAPADSAIIGSTAKLRVDFAGAAAAELFGTDAALDVPAPTPAAAATAFGDTVFVGVGAELGVTDSRQPCTARGRVQALVQIDSAR